MHRSGQMGVGFLRFSTSTESKSMKKIEAIIKPFKLEEVRSALASLGVNDITVSEVECCGRRHGLSQHHHDREYASDFHPKIKMEVMVADDLTGKLSRRQLSRRPKPAPVAMAASSFFKWNRPFAFAHKKKTNWRNAEITQTEKRRLAEFGTLPRKIDMTELESFRQESEIISRQGEMRGR